MGEESDNEVGIRPAVRAVLCGFSVVPAAGLLWTVNQSLGLWNPGVGWMSAKLAAKAAVVLFLGLVTLVSLAQEARLRDGDVGREGGVTVSVPSANGASGQA